MQTAKLISTVSFNTPEFLHGCLNRLVKGGVLDYAHWVWHEPEADETKAHAHVVMMPNKRLNTAALRMEFTELIAGEEKPRGILPCQSSKMRDWMLYAAHDAAYLLAKGQERIHQYERDAFHSTDADQLDEDWRDSHDGGNSKIKILTAYADKDLPWGEVMVSGVIPINQLFQYREIYFALLEKADITRRNGRQGHEECSHEEDNAQSE